MKQAKTAARFGAHSLRRAFTSKIGIISGIILLGLFFAILSPNFLDMANFFNITRQQSIYVLLALGMTQVIIIGNIDLSVGSCVAFCGVAAALLLEICDSAFLAIVVTLAIGAILGAINGTATAYFRMPPYIVTLATQTIFRGAAMLITGGYPVNVKNDVLVEIGRGNVFNVIPTPFVIVLAFVAITWVILNRTCLGRYIYAVGGNREAAHLAGINVKAVITYVHSMSGLLCGASAIIMIGRLATGAPNTGTGYEGQAISASVLGGAVMGAGVGTATGALLGALFIGILNNGMTLLRLSTYWQDVVRGCVIFVVVLISVMSAANNGSLKNIFIHKKNANPANPKS